MESKVKFTFLWALLWLMFGLLLDLLYAMRMDFYMDEPMRREVWRLAHAHGILLSLFYIVFYKIHGFRERLNENISFAGVILMPLGFFTGGIWATETDPSVGIFLVPVGALLFIGGIAYELLSRKQHSKTKK